MSIIGMFLGIGIFTVLGAIFLKGPLRPLAWLVGVIPWSLMVVNGIASSVDTWDAYYFAWWLGLAMIIVCILMALQTRSMEEGEQEITPSKDEMDHYLEESGEYKEGQEKLSKATARRTSTRRR